MGTVVPQPVANCTIIGWGSTEDGKDDPWPRLQKAEIPIVSFDQCQKSYINISQPLTENMFCAGFIEEGGVDSCVGDSGGPVVINGTLVGIISWAHNCAEPQFPGVNTVVANFLDWIREHTGIIA